MKTHRSYCRIVTGLVVTLLVSSRASAEWSQVELASLLDRAKDNRSQIEAAIQDVPDEHRSGLEFLLRHMPEADLKTLSADYLLENVEYAYRARQEAPWGKNIPEDIFLNEVLPYASINERRDRWRKDFYDRFRPLVADIANPSLAAARLNQQLFPLLNVKYSRQRRKADQSPYESMETGLASCTGLSILLIDACRAVGIPARFVGTPLWSDGSGNHSWVEVWDDGWHFTGAAEPTGDQLDRGWFVDRAAAAEPNDPKHGIYAVSFRQTPLAFPLVWNRSLDYIRAVNVTDRYANFGKELPSGHTAVMIQVLGPSSRNRCAANVRVKDQQGNVLYQGQSKDERFDGNDHLTFALPQNDLFQIEVVHDGHTSLTQIKTSDSGQLVTVRVPQGGEAATALEGEQLVSRAAIEQLERYLSQPPEARRAISEQPFAEVPLTRQDAALAERRLWNDHLRTIRSTREDEMQKREIVMGEWRLRFDFKTFGEAPVDGRRLFISMHGGGNTRPAVNDRQWENQQGLYQVDEGVYLCPRAPSDTWDLWHRDHIDPLFDRLIENLIAFENINPNCVYLMGYSAGGDGVYQLAPRMADRFAAVAMMAGHPNETSPLGLRNLPFTLHMGQNDGAYQRNQVAADWGRKLAELRQVDPNGYVHWVKLHENKGHWMDHEDAAAIGWMTQYQRPSSPDRVVWKQDDVTHTRFYWLAVDATESRPGTLVVASRNGQRIDIETTDIKKLVVRLNDAVVDLDRPLEVWANGQQVFVGTKSRTIATQAKTLAERGNFNVLFAAELEVEIPPVADAATQVHPESGSQSLGQR